MKSNSLLIALVGLLALSAASCAPAAQTKDEQPHFAAAAFPGQVAMEATDGKVFTLEGIRGEKGTLVVFTCNHCPYVVAWQGRLIPLANEYLDKGIGVIAINANDPVRYPADGMDGMRKRATEQGMRYPYVVDGTSGVARAFGATRTPEVFLFDKDGALVYHGAVDDNSSNAEKVTAHHLRDALEAVVKGEQPAVARTRSLGCSIKFRD